jgi:hypothetical protein
MELTNLYEFMLVKRSIDEINSIEKDKILHKKDNHNIKEHPNKELLNKESSNKGLIHIDDYYIKLFVNIIIDKDTNKLLLKKFTKLGNYSDGTTDYNYKFKTDFNYYFLEKLEAINKLISKKEKDKPRYFKVNDIILKLGNNEKVDLLTFIACCYIENINILLVNKKIASYIEFDNKFVNNPEFYKVDIHCKNDINIKKINYNDFKNEYYIVDDIIKPLKSASYYKVDDLRDIAEYLEIKTYDIVNGKQKNKTKQILYNELKNYMEV